MIEALAVLLVYQLVGETVSFALELPVPGPVIGLVALLATCAVRPGLVARVKPVATTLLAHLSLLFVPAGVGVMVHFARLADEGAAIVAAIVVSTLAAVAATAGTAALLMKRSTERR